jgi:hypothetical protein
MIFKIIMAVITGSFGWWTWRQARRWEANGEVPSEWNDGLGPVKLEPNRLSLFIIFHKGLAVLGWLFCAVCVVSLMFFPDI